MNDPSVSMEYSLIIQRLLRIAKKTTFSSKMLDPPDKVQVFSRPGSTMLLEPPGYGSLHLEL